MSGSTTVRGPYTFGQLLFANLFDKDVRTNVTDWHSLALDALCAFSDGALANLKYTVDAAGLKVGGKLIDANGALYRHQPWSRQWRACRDPEWLGIRPMGNRRHDYRESRCRCRRCGLDCRNRSVGDGDRRRRRRS